MDWEAPPLARPRTDQPSSGQGFDRSAFHLYEATKIRLQYCEDQTLRAGDWHSHMPGQQWQSGGQIQTAQELFGSPQRGDPESPWHYKTKPMVAVAWQDAQELAERLSTSRVRFALPSEAQWEMAARGGLIGARHAWGDEPPSPERCDFGRFYQFVIQPMKSLPPNGYGLYAMNGGVWEWTRDWYDSTFYRQGQARQDPEGPEKGEEKVLRGGSWADCAEVQTVTFRMSRGSSSWRDGQWGANLAPNIGFRLCRMMIP
jgi:formylglycine-generating enzyme required for sulfatase activity